MIQSILRALMADGNAVPLTKSYAWFCTPGRLGRTGYSTPTKVAPKVDARFADPIKGMIGKEPSFACRTVAWLPGFKK